VATIPVFTIEGGIVVHNCYDEVSFAISMHSKVTTEKDRYNEEMLDLARELSGGSVSRDPYAVRTRRV
jgi:hypothetical protein